MPVLGQVEKKMGCGKMKVACEDGFELITSKEHELVHIVQAHVKEFHHKDVSRDEVMKMAKHP
jgi:predicted small metal-binding protein